MLVAAGALWGVCRLVVAALVSPRSAYARPVGFPYRRAVELLGLLEAGADSSCSPLVA